MGGATFTDRVTTPAWANRPCWYIASGQDRAVSVALQRKIAIRLKADTTELKSSHMSLFSAPQPVANIMIETASAVGALAQHRGRSAA